MRLLLIGQAPSKGGDTSKSLTGRAGRKIATLAGVSMFKYLRRTERVNLLDRWPGRKGKGDLFPRKEARQSAERLRPCLDRRVVIFVGRAVADAFGFKPKGFCIWHTHTNPLCIWGVIPHTSGIVRWWNSRLNVMLASKFLQSAFQQWSK